MYLGQPLSPSGSAQIQSLATNPATVGQIVRSQAVVRDVAEEVGIRPAKLRSGISTKTVSGAVARQGQNPLVEVTVRGPWRRESAEAANLLAARVVDEVDASYTEVKIRTLTDQLDSLEMQLGSVDARLDELADAVLAPGLDSTREAHARRAPDDARAAPRADRRGTSPPRNSSSRSPRTSRRAGS